MEQTLLVLARVVHIIAGSMIVGTAILNSMFVMPSIRAAGPAGGQVMAQMVKRKLPVVMSSNLVLLFLSGLYLMWHVSGHFQGEWFGTRFGIAITTGITLTVLAAGFGQGVAGPTMRKMQKLLADAQAAGGPPSPETQAEVARLQDRLQTVMRTAALMVVLAGAAMAAARYL